VNDHEDGYTGPATLHIGSRTLPVQARLDARHEPLDGRLHWFGRVRPNGDEPVLAAADVEIVTPGGRAAGRLGERDPWGRYRVTGVGAPPYPVDQPDLD
jgi:hypothetical protein